MKFYYRNTNNSWKYKGIAIRSGIPAAAAVLFAVVFLNGCSRPSRITVTGFGPVQEQTGGTEAQNASAKAGGIAMQDASEQKGDTAAQNASARAGGFAMQDASVQKGDTAAQGFSPEQIAVYVCGAVHNPGVCSLQAGARVCDALDAAGGFLDSADTQWLNQAKPLTDGEMIIAYTLEETARMREQGVSRGAMAPGDVPEGALSTGGLATSAGGMNPDPGTDSSMQSVDLINLNTASREQLMTLPGIGEAKADAIIRYRSETGLFASPEDVMNISGIKNSVFEKIRSHITV